MTILKSLLYYVITGMAAFFIGRFLPKQWVDAHKPLYRSHPYEQDGRIYERLHIRRWQNKVPDMSRLLPGRMPPKSLQKHIFMCNKTARCMTFFVHRAVYLAVHMVDHTGKNRHAIRIGNDKQERAVKDKLDLLHFHQFRRGFYGHNGKGGGCTAFLVDHNPGIMLRPGDIQPVRIAQGAEI